MCRSLSPPWRDSRLGEYGLTPLRIRGIEKVTHHADLTMLARRNGREISRGNARDLYHDFTKMVERGSRDAMMYRGDLIGSGTVGTGCILELGPEKAGGWLQPGETLELEIERLGTLTTPIV
jgi:fumarylacetoacetate (FAA) hydrolase